MIRTNSFWEYLQKIQKMKNKILVIGLILLSHNVLADFKYVTSNDIGDEFYVDFSSREVNKNLVRVLMLTRYQKPIDGALSASTDREFDCTNNAYRTFSAAFYWDKNATKVKDSFKINKEWLVVPSNSSISTVMQAACKK
jgi:hypothetical protein